MKKSYKNTSKTLRGIVKKANKSKGFFVDDIKYDSQYKLGKKEVYKAFQATLWNLFLQIKVGQEYKR